MEVRIGPCLCGEPEKVIEESGRQVLIRCPLYTKVEGRDPQNDNPIEHWACALAWLPTLLIENSKEVRQGAAATESFRNVMLELNKGVPPEVIEGMAMARIERDGS